MFSFVTQISAVVMEKEMGLRQAMTTMCVGFWIMLWRSSACTSDSAVSISSLVMRKAVVWWLRQMQWFLADVCVMCTSCPPQGYA
jgi:hypothetical protein